VEPFSTAAVRFHHGVLHAFGRVGGALEHHVLEEMREAGAALLFGARADIVDHVDSDHGDGVVLREDDAQAVLQLVGFHGNAEFGREGQGGAGDCQAAGKISCFMRLLSWGPIY
jgi:hypothetical protein